MKFTESITTAYSFSDDLNDPKSDLFKEYASILEPEMSQIMMRFYGYNVVDLYVVDLYVVDLKSDYLIHICLGYKCIITVYL